MTEENLESHIEDIINALKSSDSEKEVSRDEIEREFSKFMEYGVPIDQAKQTLVKKYGGVAVFTSQIPSERTLISDLKPNQGSVKLLGRVIAVNPKDITVKGEERTIFYGIIGDESGTIPFTAWKNLEIEKGDVIEISNAYTREWQGAVQLNFGDRVQIEKTDKEKLPKSAFEPREFKVKDLRSGLGTVDVTAKIIEVNERSPEIDGEIKKVFSGIIADETGKAQFTSWHDFKLKEGDVIRINGGYVKSWKGIPQLTFDQNATVKKLDKKKVAIRELQVHKMPMHVLIEKRGALETDFDRYICEPVIYYTKFRSIFNELSASEREADNTTKGKIEKIRVIEEGDFLRFLVNYSTNNNEGREVADYTVIRCRIANEALRKFILFYVNQKWKSLGTGNLLSKLLAGMIPLFKKNKSENLKIMEKITSEYSKTLKIIANLDAQIAKTNSSLDSKIYDLYGLNNEERKLIESEIPESALIPETD